MDMLSIPGWTTGATATVLCALMVLAGIDVIRIARRSRGRTKSPSPRPLVTFVMLTSNVVLILGLATVSIGIGGLSMIYLTGH